MTEVQILSKVLSSGNPSIILDNNLLEEYFPNYLEEYRFIMNHYLEYGNPPDVETFLDKFVEFDLVDVHENDSYLVNAIKEENFFSKLSPVINRVAEIAPADSYGAVDYLISVIPSLLQDKKKAGVDIISAAEDRYYEWVERNSGSKESFFIPTGFKELDDEIGGFSRGEELVVLLARTGNGKTWVLMKMLESAWASGFRVGLIEPEMSYNRVGYRFDTLNSHLSNSRMIRGGDIDGYKEHIEALKHKSVPFIVATPKDFSNKVTVSKLRNFCISNKLDMLAVDGISYLKDDRAVRGDNKSTALTNISEDLMSLSVELKMPILVVAQSNRGGTMYTNGPEVENIRGSDGISFNASLIISVIKKEPGIIMSTKKSRNGETGDDKTYIWDADKGTFKFVPTCGSTRSADQVEAQRRRYKDSQEVF